MTEKTLSQRLPVGDPRNKVEFLADEFEKTAADLYSRLGGNEPPAVNLISNAKFSENVELHMHMRYLRSQKTVVAADNNKTINNGRSSMMVCADWAVEIEQGLDNVVGFKVEPLSDSTVNYSNIDKDSGVLSYFANDFTLYQILTVPHNGFNHKNLKGRFYLSGAQGQEVTVGIARLIQDADGSLRIWRREGEKTTVIEKTDPWAPVMAESLPVSAKMTGGDGLMAFYMQVKKSSGSGRIYSAELWHTDIYGESPEQFTHRHNPYSYLRSVGWKNIVASSAEVVGVDTIKYHLGRSFPLFFAANQQLIVEQKSIDSTTITAITPDSITMTYSNADYVSRVVNQSGQIYQFIGVQYSAMPVGIGFY